MVLEAWYMVLVHGGVGKHIEGNVDSNDSKVNMFGNLNRKVNESSGVYS